MADNVTLPGTGEIVATEDFGGAEYQKIKQVDGRAGSTTPAGVRPDNNSMVAIEDLTAAILMMLERIENPMYVDPSTGRMRVMLDAAGGGQTLATVTTVTGVTTVSTVTTVTTVTGVTTVSTVTSVTNLAQIGSIAANSLVLDAMQNAWANSVLRGIS